MNKLGLIPPAVAAAVAVNQLVLVQTTNLSPWKGGGFGMFSTLDAADTRFVRIYLTFGEAEVLLPHVAELKEELGAFAAQPGAKRGQSLLAAVLSREWGNELKAMDLPDSTRNAYEQRAIDGGHSIGARVEALRIKYAPANRSVMLDRIFSLERARG